MQTQHNAIKGYTGLRVFSATKMVDRHRLGDEIAYWLASEKIEVVDTTVTQSSDSEFHCLAITIFYKAAT